MAWQDIAISFANLLFTYSLVYQVLHGYKLKKAFLTLTTTAMTSIGLYVVAASLFTLGLVYSAIVCVLNAALWTILFVQRIYYKKAK